MDDIHLIDRAVTAVAAHATVHMHRMVKIGVIRQTMHLHPGNRLSGLPALTHKGKARAVGTDLAIAVAIDTGLRGREIGMACHLDKAVAVAAIHPKLLHMESMGKGHGLVRLIADAGVFRREIIPNAQRDGRTHNQHTDEDLERQPIGPSGEKVRHRVIKIARLED